MRFLLSSPVTCRWKKQVYVMSTETSLCWLFLHFQKSASWWQNVGTSCSFTWFFYNSRYLKARYKKSHFNPCLSVLPPPVSTVSFSIRTLEKKISWWMKQLDWNQQSAAILFFLVCVVRLEGLSCRPSSVCCLSAELLTAMTLRLKILSTGADDPLPAEQHK